MDKQAKAKLILTEAIAFLAKKEGISVAQVWAYLEAGHEGALRQLSQLCGAAIVGTA